MSEIKVNSISSLSGSNGPVISGIATMVSSGAMTLPRGDTAYRGGRGRGVFGGGYGASSPWPTINTIDYVTIATLGNAHDFGDLTVKRTAKTGGSSATRGVFISGRFPGGNPAAANVMDYVEIQSTGNAGHVSKSIMVFDRPKEWNPAKVVVCTSQRLSIFTTVG